MLLVTLGVNAVSEPKLNSFLENKEEASFINWGTKEAEVEPEERDRIFNWDDEFVGIKLGDNQIGFNLDGDADDKAGGDGGAEFAIDANLFGFGVDGGVGVGDDGLGVDAGINLGPLGRIGADANLDADKDGISAGVGADATNLLSADADAAVNFKFLETNTETSDRV